MKIGLLTTVDEKCGIAEYGRYLRQFIPDVEWLVFGRDYWNASALINSEYDILHVNWEPGLYRDWLDTSVIHQVKAHGKKTLLTLHTSHVRGNRTEFPCAFDKVVMHERNEDLWTVIPMGIPVHLAPNGDPEPDGVGTVGFPFYWKGFHQVAEAAEMLGKKWLIIAPESPHIDTGIMKQAVFNTCSNGTYETAWLSDSEIVNRLSRCEVNVFAYSGENGGISGAVRLGLAARRPLVLTRCRQFRDLFDYPEEIEFVDKQDSQLVANGIRNVLASGKRPKRVLEDMSWVIVGEEYKKIYQELMA